MVDKRLNRREELEAKIQKIFNRTVARSLGAMDIAGSSPEVKQAVKDALWDCSHDVIELLDGTKKGK